MKLMQKDKGEGADIYANTYRKDDLSWRAIVFLPFNIYWRTIVAALCIIYFNVIIYEEIFAMESENDGDNEIHNALSFISCVYLIDTILSILHKTWESVQKAMPYEPKSSFTLIVDMVSLLPIRLLMGNSFLNRDHTINWLQVVGMNGCLRVYRIFIELINLRTRKGANPIIVAVIQDTVFHFSLVSVLCSIWYVLGYALTASIDAHSVSTQVVSRSWMDDIIISTDLNINSPTQMYLFCVIHIYALLSGEIVADVRSVNYIEVSFVIFIFYFGYVLRYGFVFSNTINSFIQYQRHTFKKKNHILINLACLRGKHVNELKTYYNAYWKNWYGLQKCPQLEKFPLCLRKDVLTDVYWDAISHSHVLRNFTTNIKRELSLVMESKFLQPGDYIYRKGELKNTYYYIATGVVQIMSHYDGVSPVMTISSGSCLGGVSLILCTQSPTDVICATVCEVRFLRYKNFYDVLLRYPNGIDILKHLGFKHIGEAKKMFVLSNTQKEESAVMKLYGIPREDKLKWIKRRWRTLKNVAQGFTDLNFKTIRKIEEDMLPIEGNHTSRNLDIIVLSNEIKWEADKCCFRSKWSYVLEPDCNFVIFWLTFICIMISLDCVVVSYRAAFLTETTDFHIVWDHIIFFAYIFDVFFQAITGVRSVDRTIMEPMPLLRHHLKNPRFLFDIVGAIPTREFARLYIQEVTISPKLALIRLCKFVRVFSFFKYRYSLIMSNHLVTHIMKYLYIFCFMTFVCTCIAFLNSCRYDSETIEVKCEDASWYVLAADLGKIEYPENKVEREKIAQMILSKALPDAIQYIYRYLLKTGLKSFPPISMKDINLCAIFVFLANNLLILVSSELIAMEILSNRRRFGCKELIINLKSILSQKNVHWGLLNILDSFLSLQWKVSLAIEQSISDTSFSEISSPILVAERQKIILSCLESVEFFKNISSDNFTRVCKACRLFTVPEDFIFCRAGDQPSSFNIIINGYCNLTSMLKEDVYIYPEGKIIGPGASFPLMEVAQNIPCFQTTVSVTVCEVAAIDVIELRAILYSDELISNDIQSAIQFDIKDVDIVISKKKYSKKKRKTPSFVRRRVKKNYKKTTAFTILLRSVTCIWKPPFIIHPFGKFIFIWETIKVIQIILTILYLPNLHHVICGKPYITRVFPIVLHSISLFDILIRLHVGHFKENGLLVHNTSYYFTHSFSIDLISSIPIQNMILEYSYKIKFFITVLMKTSQIYRIHGYITALDKKFDIGGFKILFFDFFVHWLLITSLFSGWLFADACSVECEGSREILKCEENSSLLSNNLFTDKWTPYRLLLISCNIMVTVFLGNDQSAFYLPVDARASEIWLIHLYGTIAVAAKYYYVCKGAGLLVGGCLYFTKHRESIGLYWFFVQNEGGSKDLALKISNHSHFQFLRLRGIKMNVFINTLHPSLQSDLTYAIYYKSMLCLHEFVGESSSFMKRLTKKVDEVYYKKNYEIIRVNEVSNSIYFIREGNVNVYNSEKDFVKQLGPGSMFGSFQVLGKKRHEKEFVSSGQSNILVIQSSQFFVILKDYGHQYEKKFLEETKGLEFILYNPNPVVDALINKARPSQRSEEPRHSDVGSVDTIIDESEKFSWLHRNHSWYKWCMFFICAIVPYITVFPLLLSILSEEKHHTLYVILVYILDIISSAKIFLNLCSTYIDEITGVFVDSMLQIRMEYLLAPTDFLLDFISCFPLEIFGYFMDRKWYSILRLNRLLKIIIMINFMRYHRDKIYVRPFLRWFEFISFVTLLPFVCACFWQYTTCHDSCTLVHEHQIITVTDPYRMLLHSFREIITLYTFSPSYHLQKPWNTIECIVIIIISLLSFMILPAIIGCFNQISQMSNHTRKIFDYNVQCMKLYLQLRDLSESLLEALWNYSILIWNSDRGEILPYYVQIAPSNMQCELVYDLYGAHIEYNILFDSCHQDFIVQLSGRLNRSLYFPGDYIIRKFDVDGRMYFINSGEVEALEFDELYKELVKDVFITGQCFGLRQGLFDCAPHMATYKARSMVEMLTLAKSDWEDLAIAFPEDKENVFKMAKKLSLDDIHSAHL